jgi:uncharacterized protein YdeI (YjbR/CyaY-like superfamily)
MEEQIVFHNREEFRSWLFANGNINKGIWLIFGKDGKLETVKAEEALREALCFGWIDGQLKSIDDTKYIKKFTPRRKGSEWSEKNKGLALKLIEEGTMTERGYETIEQAKADGTWDAPKKREPIADAQIADFMDAVRGAEPAYSNLEKMSRSVKATYTGFYLDTKSEETRARRLQQIIGRLNENKKPM